MKSRTSLSSLFFCLFSLLLCSPLALASPVKRQLLPAQPSLSRRLADALETRSKELGLSQRDVIAPRITSLDANSVWPVGSTQTVTWDTSEIPANDTQITNPIGRIILGFDSGDSLNLDLDHPLAEGFHLRVGQVNVVVPDVPPRDNYIVVLIGDSGNSSPTFAITRISSGGTSSSSPPAPTTTQGGIAPGPSPTASTTLTAPPGFAATATTTQPAVLSSTTITDPIPITGSTITGGDPNASTEFPTFSDSTAAGTANPALTTQASGASSRVGCSHWPLLVAAIFGGMVVLV